MKNILAENMLRFGAKNLSTQTISKLQKLAEQEQAASINYQVNEGGVKSMLALRNIESGNPVLLADADPAVKIITLGTEAKQPTPAGAKLYSVENNANAITTKIGQYNITIGNFGIYDTETKKMGPLTLQVGFTTGVRIYPQKFIPIKQLSTEQDVIKLFAMICKNLEDGKYPQSVETYKYNAVKLVEMFKMCELTKTAPLPANTANTDVAFQTFNKSTMDYIRLITKG